MNTAQFSIKRPIFITSIMLLVLILGVFSLKKLGVDMFPDATNPIIVVTTVYVGASSEEVENLISKPIEEELGSISGLKKLTSTNQEGVSLVQAEFTLETDFKSAEQEVRDRISKVRSKLPDDIEEPIFQRFDPSDFPVLKLAIQADLPPNELYDVAKEDVKRYLEQIDNVGSVKVTGGTRREIQIELDRNKLNSYGIPAYTVATQLMNSGANVPIGKYEKGNNETLFRSIGQFENLDQIRNSVISFSGDINSSVTLNNLGVVRDGSEDVKTLSYLYYPVDTELAKDKVRAKRKIKDNQTIKRESRPALVLDVYKQSGSNTVKVADSVLKRISKINEELKDKPGHPRILLIFDGSRGIRINEKEVSTTIIIGIILAIFVVYLFLGNIRSTIITGIAIPNSLLGAFILMYIMGFTINIMTLMALSLVVGLLIDDAIVVRENIFRKLESGLHPFKAASLGTAEVMLAVIATSLTVIAVFMPMGFLSGTVGQYFKQFGFTIVFAMLISLFDALTVAPFLSAYFVGNPDKSKNFVVRAFDRFQDWMEKIYSKIMNYSLGHPLAVLGITIAILFGSLLLAFNPKFGIKSTFMPDSDFGEFVINLELPAGTSIARTDEIAREIQTKMQTIPEINYITTTVGNDQGEANVAQIGIFLVSKKERNISTNDAKEIVRKKLKEYAIAKPTVASYGWTSPYVLNLIGDDLDELQAYADKVIVSLQKIPEITEIKSSSQGGKPEYHINLSTDKMQMLGVTPRVAGGELRYQVAGGVVGKLHQNDLEYDIRLRLRPEQRDINKAFSETKVPNMQMRMIPLSDISTGKVEQGPSKIIRQNRARVIQITANLVPNGAIGKATKMTNDLFASEIKPPVGIKAGFIGQSQDFTELKENIAIAFILAILFIYLVLASLYDSFITPVTILFALPPAMSGALLALFMTRQSMNMFSMIGMVMLLGLVTKNAILLVDFAIEGMKRGLSRNEAIYEAGMIRLRPIMMTTFAMLAGTLPLALGIGEAAKYRQSMGIAIIGGVIVSTLITLIVVPAVFSYIDRFREWIESVVMPDLALMHKGVDLMKECTDDSCEVTQESESVPRTKTKSKIIKAVKAVKDKK